MILSKKNASYFPTMLELLHSVWLCSHVTAKPPDLRNSRQNTLLLKLPTQHTRKASTDNGRQSTDLTISQEAVVSPECLTK